MGASPKLNIHNSDGKVSVVGCTRSYNLSIRMNSGTKSDIYSITTGGHSSQYYVKSPERYDMPIDIHYERVSVLQVVRELYDQPCIRVQASQKEIEDMLINVQVKSTCMQCTYQSMADRIMKDIESLLKIKLTVIERECDVYRLYVADNTKITKRYTDPASRSCIETNADSIFMNNVYLQHITHYAEKVLNRFFTLVQEINAPFSLTLRHFRSVESLTSQLYQYYGLGVEKEKENVQILLLS